VAARREIGIVGSGWSDADAVSGSCSTLTGTVAQASALEGIMVERDPLTSGRHVVPEEELCAARARGRSAGSAAPESGGSTVARVRKCGGRL